MVESPQPEETPEAAQELSRSYGAMLGPGTWEVDAGELPDPSPGPASGAPVADAPGSPPPLVRIVEALLFAGGAPLTAARAEEVVRGLTAAQLTEAIDRLNRDYRRQGRPYAIVPQGPGYVLALRPRYRGVLEQLYGGPREARLSPQAIDVLALVAYRQPATRAEIDSLRGADSGALLRQLVRHGLVAVTRRAEAAQREVSYGTTPRFLQLFGLRSLDDLPQTQDLQRL